eukprot:gene8491-8581_t
MPHTSTSQAATRFAVPRGMLVGFVIAALATVLIALVNFRTAQVRAQAVEAMDETTVTMRHLNLFVSSLKDAETGQRGYLLTGDDTYLQPYNLSLGAMERNMARLKELTNDSAVQRRLVVQIDDLRHEKLRELGETIELRRSKGQEAAVAVTRSDAGRVLMDRIRDLASDLSTLLNQQLESDRKQWVEAASMSTYYSWGGSFVLLVLICLSAAANAREYRLKAQQSWVAAGLNGLSQRIQGDHRLEDLGQLTLEYLAQYLRAAVGAGYVADCNGALTLFGGYALPRERLEQRLLPGEGLVGQVARSRQMLHVRDVPAGHLMVSSSTGQSAPTELLLAPAIENGEVFAVIELGFHRPVTEPERTLMERASQMLAVAVRAGIDRNRLEALLEETQRQSEELQTQQEELRVSNEELEQQSRILQESQAQMEVQQTELEQTNAHLEAQTQQLEYQREQLLRAQSAMTDKARELELALQTLIDPLRPLAQEKGLTFTATVAPDAPTTLDTDPQRLGQVLKNLLSNALKFTEKGSVALHVSRNPDDTLSFAVKDTGIGIPAHQQELIFEAFRQADGSTHRKYGGTGLGLSISRDLAQLLGGSIHVHSTPGEGSVFTLVLPQKLVPSSPEAAPATPLAAPAPAHTAAPVVAPAASAPASPPAAAPTAPVALRRASARSILVIEDDVRFAQILGDLAGEMDFDCHLAHNAADGLAYAVHSLPSAIVLDVNLPDFSGLGVLDQLKRNPATRHIPVHVVSVADYSQEALGRGAVGYALKPVKRDELVHALQRLEAKFTQNLRRVLVVEDDERQRESVRHLLTNDDVEIVGAGTAAEALAHLRGSTFDCMVMDLNLPDLSGYELLQQMTEQDGVSFPPVIVYTGRALSRDEEQQLRRFSKSIIIKDARSPERLLDEVTLFLHQVESELSAEHRQMLQVARNRETALEGRNVLVVEDDVRNVFALSSILEPTGIRVEIARNGLEALQALERWRRLPIIALTAKAMKDDQEKCLAAGANDYIAKPLDVEKLLSLVRVWMPK